MRASKLVIDKLQAEVNELKLRVSPSLDNVQEQLKKMCTEKVEEIYNETSKFVNILEDKVDKQGREWEQIQKEAVNLQNA